MESGDPTRTATGPDRTGYQDPPAVSGPYRPVDGSKGGFPVGNRSVGRLSTDNLAIESCV